VAAAALAEFLGTYRQPSQPGPDGLVFTSTGGRCYAASNSIRRVWRPATQRSPRGLRFHEWRHTSAVLSIAAGASTRS
jgi:integrase